MVKLFSILWVKASLVLCISILIPSIVLGTELNNRNLLKTIQNQIELGNLSQASKLLEQVEDSAYKRALQANLAARVGDYEGAIALYENLIDRFQGKDGFRVAWNYIQVLRERIEYYDWQLQQEFDSIARQSLQTLIKSDRDLALVLARRYRDDLEIAVLLWQLKPEEVDRNLIEKQILILPDSPIKVEMLLAIEDVDEAFHTSQRLNNPLFLSWTYGELGKTQLKQGQVENAIASFNRASLFANQAHDDLALARWQGYLGTAYIHTRNVEKAKLNYEIAVNAIERIRKKVSGYRVDPLLIKEIQPILRDYLALLLNSSDSESLKKAIEIQKLSTLSELDAYFKSLCDVEVETSSAIQPDTAYIYTIILDDRLYFIVQTSEGYISKRVDIAKSQLDGQLYRWRLALADPSTDRYIEDSRNLYNLLIRPIEPQIRGKKRLIFVQDGLLRTVPMGALIDGDEFLIERYTIAYSLGFKLQKPDRRLRTALVAGASETSTEFLPSIDREVALLGEILNADILFGNQLSEQTLSRKLQENSYDILHIATRNQIMPNIEQSRFSLEKEDISLLEFEQMLLNRKDEIAFLNLAGCDTATGNSVAILGLTGIGLRTGIVNTVGSLWGIPDENTTDFMLQFYKNLQKTEDYENSLRQAQLNVIDNPSLRPYAWAGFIVLTNE